MPATTGTYPDFYSNLPGMITELKDGVQNRQNQGIAGKNVALIGTALDGPVLEPVSPNSFNQGEEIFSTYYDRGTKTFNGATLMRGYKRAANAGADNVTLLRVGGKNASGEIELYQETRKNSFQARDYAGKYPGNIETDFDLNISVADGCDDVYVTNVTVIADGTPLSNDKFNVNGSSGIVTVYQDSADSGADILIKYTLVDVTIKSVTDEVADCTNIKTGTEFQLENYPIVDNGNLVVTYDDGSTTTLYDEGTDFEIDREQGLIVLDSGIDVEGGESLLVSYDYKDLAETASENTGALDGTDFIVELDHTADATQPVVVTLDGTEISEDDFDINYSGQENTRLFIHPGLGDKGSMGSDIYVKYYWYKSEVINPVIEAESIYGGNLYNKTSLEIKDKLVETTSTDIVDEDHTGSAVQMVDEGSSIWAFPDNDTNIVEGTEVIYDGDPSASDVELTAGNEYTLDASAGEVDISEYTLQNSALYVEYYEHKENVTAYHIPVDKEIVDKETDTKLSFNHRYIKPESINITINQDGGSTLELTETDSIDVNYAQGTVDISGAYTLASGDSVEADYSYYNVASKVVKLYRPEEKVAEDDENPIKLEIGDVVNTIGELVTQLNNHPSNNVLDLRIEEDFVGLSAMELKTPDKKVLDDGSIAKNTVSLRFGEDGINLTKEEMYDALEGTESLPGAYEVLLEEEDIDVVIPLGVYADDKLASEFKSFDQQLANFCARAFYRNNEIQGLIGVKPLKNPSRVNVINRANRLAELDTDYFLTNGKGDFISDREGNKVDIGKFISIIAHDLRYNDSNLAVPSIENGAPAFAGMSSMLKENNSPTNEAVSGATLPYRYSSAQANSLVGNRLIVFKERGGMPRVTSAVTCAQPGSGWTRCHTMEIAYSTIEMLRDVYEPYIGKGNTLEMRNSLDSDIRNALKKKDTIVDFDYSLVQSSADKLMGRLVVELDIIPVGELQKIHTTVAINAQLD